MGLTSYYLALARRNATPRQLASFRDFEHLAHVAQTPVGTHSCAVVYTRDLSVPHGLNLNSCRCARKINLIHIPTGFSFGKWLTSNPKEKSQGCRKLRWRTMIIKRLYLLRVLLRYAAAVQYERMRFDDMCLILLQCKRGPATAG